MAQIFTARRACQCDGKKRYETKKKAKRYSRRANRVHLQIYRCPHCGWFHIGHKPKR